MLIQKVQTMLAISLILMVTTACKPVPKQPFSPLETPTPYGEEKVFFKTLLLSERGEDNDYWLFAPALFLIPTPEDLAQVEPYFQPEVLEGIQRVDLDRYTLLVLFRGKSFGSGYRTVIERITRQNELLTIHAQFWGPSPHELETEEISSPYHIVRTTSKQTSNAIALRYTLQSGWITPTPPSRLPRQTGTQEIPFETLSLREDGTNINSNDQLADPTLFLIQSMLEVAQVEPYLQPEILDQIRTVDFEQHMVLILFRGLTPSSGYRTEIERIVQHNGELVVHAQFWSPSPHFLVTAAHTSILSKSLNSH